MSAPRVDELAATVDALREWPRDGMPIQLHLGDVGWLWRFGPERTAASLRTWSRDGRIVAAGMRDGDELVRMAIAPELHDDEELARQLHADLATPSHGVLGDGKVYVEAPSGSLVRDLLSEAGWQSDAPWTSLRRDLADPVEEPGVRIEVTGPEQVSVRTAVQRAAFDNSTFTDDRWHAMASGPAYAEARCLVAHDGDGTAVAAITVWSAGPGRPGLVEPMGVHRDHRGRGHGRAITVAGAAALRELGSSSALVCTRSSNVGGVATYVSAGFEALAEVPDLRRDG